MQQTRLDEPVDDALWRREVRRAEVGLMRHREKPASRRRQPPRGAAERGVDLLAAVWDLVDLTPRGGSNSDADWED